jgi:glycosyltransferase involved in cell wall biosynthesis
MYWKKRSKNRTSNLPIIAYIGNLHEDRFPVAFARILGKISQRYPFQLFLYSPMTRSNFQRARVLEAILREEKVRHRIVVENLKVEDKARVLSLSDIVVFPFTRKVESKMLVIDPPLTLIEAMSLGKIVVCTRVLSISSIIKNRYNGYITDPDSPSEFAAALENALDNVLSSEFLGKRAHDSVEGKFSPDSARREVMRIYDDIFAEEDPR